MRTAWRLIKGVYAKEAFTGTGSRLHGTRWTPRGVPVGTRPNQRPSRPGKS